MLNFIKSCKKSVKIVFISKPGALGFQTYPGDLSVHLPLIFGKTHYWRMNLDPRTARSPTLATFRDGSSWAPKNPRICENPRSKNHFLNQWEVLNGPQVLRRTHPRRPICYPQACSPPYRHTRTTPGNSHRNGHSCHYPDGIHPHLENPDINGD